MPLPVVVHGGNLAYGTRGSRKEVQSERRGGRVNR